MLPTFVLRGGFLRPFGSGEARDDDDDEVTEALEELKSESDSEDST